MSDRRRIAVGGSIVVGLMAVAVSVLIGGGWAIILLELAGLGLFLFFWRDQGEEEASESAEQE